MKKSHFYFQYLRGVVSLIAILFCAAPAFAQSDSHDSQPLLTGSAAMGDWQKDAPGVRRKITVSDLPPPYATKSAAAMSHIVARPEGASPKVPPGFKAELIASGLNNPRKIIAAPNGDLFVAESAPGDVKILRQGKNGEIVKTTIFADHLTQPFGIAFYPPGKNPKYVYVANTGSVVRFPYENGDLKARGAAEMIVPDIPSGGHLTGGGHWTRDIVFSRDGKKMFVSVGSHSNDSDDALEKHRADVLEYNPDGSGFRIFASGIRNSVGLAIDPTTGELWGSTNERDGLGDNLPPDYITHFQDGGFYGWPWYYIGDHPDPRHKGAHPELARKVIVPDVLLQAHSASLCLTFYNADQFPARFRGGIFAAEHGSWNRAKRTGYKVIFVPVKNGKATGEYDDFMTGFVVDSKNVWARPVGITVDKSGALIVSEDGHGTVWRISYDGAKK